MMEFHHDQEINMDYLVFKSVKIGREKFGTNLILDFTLADFLQIKSGHIALHIRRKQSLP